MRQAITTKYLAPTNHRGARVKATCHAVQTSVTVAWLHEFNAAENHYLAVRALLRKIDWRPSPASELVGGWLNPGSACWFGVFHGSPEYWLERLAEDDLSSKCLDDEADRAVVARVIASVFKNAL